MFIFRTELSYCVLFTCRHVNTAPCDLCLDSIVSFDEKEYNEKLARTLAKKGWLLPFLNCRPTLVYIMDSCDVYFVILCAKHKKIKNLKNLLWCISEGSSAFTFRSCCFYTQ